MAELAVYYLDMGLNAYHVIENFVDTINVETELTTPNRKVKVLVPKKTETNLMRFGFKIGIRTRTERGAHDYQRMELKPVGWKPGDRTVICNVPHRTDFIEIVKTFVVHGRMKDYQGQASKTGLHIPQTMINAIENTPSAALSLRVGMEQLWKQEKGSYVSKNTSITLAKGWIDKFGEIKVLFDMKYSEEHNTVFVETSATVKAGLSMSKRELDVLREILTNANEVACSFLNKMGTTGR